MSVYNSEDKQNPQEENLPRDLEYDDLDLFILDEIAYNNIHPDNREILISLLKRKFV